MSCKLTLHLQRIRRVDLSQLAEKIKCYGHDNLFTIVENNNRAPEHYKSFLHQPLSCKWVSHLGVLCLSHFAVGQRDVIKTKVLIFFFTFSVLLPRLTAPGSSNRLIIKDLCDSVSRLRASAPTREGRHTRGNRKIFSNVMILSYFAKYYFFRCFRYLFPVLLVFKKFKVRMVCKKLFEGLFVRHFYHLPRADSEAGYTGGRGGNYSF